MNFDAATSAVLESRAAPAAHEEATKVTNVSLVVPVYNEREGVDNLLTMLSNLEAELSRICRFQFVLVDDGSVDGTADLLESQVHNRANHRVIRHKMNRGVAAAIYTGLTNADYEIVVSIDCDGSYDATAIGNVLPRFQDDVDLLTASPYHPEGSVENVPAWRLVLSQFASHLYRIAMRRKLYCYTSCFRFYRRSQFLHMRPEFGGFIGVAELIWKADRLGLGIEEFPAILRTRQVGKSKMKVARASLQHLYLLGRITADRLTRGRYFAPK